MKKLNLRIENFGTESIKEYDIKNHTDLNSIHYINITREREENTMIINIESEGEEMDYYCNLENQDYDNVEFINTESFNHFGFIFQTTNTLKIWDIIEVLIPEVGILVDMQAKSLEREKEKYIKYCSIMSKKNNETIGCF